jgi:hypothetical protein
MSINSQNNLACLDHPPTRLHIPFSPSACSIVSTGVHEYRAHRPDLMARSIKAVASLCGWTNAAPVIEHAIAMSVLDTWLKISQA